jgi:hypothetical protein
MENLWWIWVSCVFAGWIFAGYGIYTSEIKERGFLAFWYLTLFLNVLGFIFFVTFEQ